MDEIGYLVESNTDQAMWVGISGGRFYWTLEANEALRFSREEDCINLMTFLLNHDTQLAYRGDLHATEHMWQAGDYLGKDK